MLIHQTLDKLRSMRLHGMVSALEEQLTIPDAQTMSFEERLGFVVDREEVRRNEIRYKNRIRQAKLKQQACMEDVDFNSGRGFSKPVLLSLSDCNWIINNQDIIFTGSTGVGKSYLASALVHKACRNGYCATFYRAQRLLGEIAVSRLDGSFTKTMAKIAKIDVIVLDDFGITALSANEARDFLEIIEDRHKLRSTIITSQLPLDKWFDVIGDKTIADAIMDRLVNNAHKFDLKGPSMRKKLNELDSKGGLH